MRGVGCADSPPTTPPTPPPTRPQPPTSPVLPAQRLDGRVDGVALLGSVLWVVVGAGANEVHLGVVAGEDGGAVLRIVAVARGAVCAQLQWGGGGVGGRPNCRSVTCSHMCRVLRGRTRPPAHPPVTGLMPCRLRCSPAASAAIPASRWERASTLPASRTSLLASASRGRSKVASTPAFLSSLQRGEGGKVKSLLWWRKHVASLDYSPHPPAPPRPTRVCVSPQSNAAIAVPPRWPRAAIKGLHLIAPHCTSMGTPAAAVSLEAAVQVEGVPAGAAGQGHSHQLQQDSYTCRSLCFPCRAPPNSSSSSPRRHRQPPACSALPVGAALAAAAAAGGQPSPASAAPAAPAGPAQAAATATAPGLARRRRGWVGAGGGWAGAGVFPRFFLSFHILPFTVVMVTMLACQMKAPM